MRFPRIIPIVLLFATSVCAQERCPAARKLDFLLSGELALSEPDPCCLPQNPEDHKESQQPGPTATVAPAPTPSSSTPSDPSAISPQPSGVGVQPKRILGVMPNFRAVSADVTPPPPTPKQNLKIATQNSFDYSAYIFAAFTTLEAEASDAHPELGKGVSGFGRYYWRGFLDRTDGNYWTIFILPTLLHQDQRYYAMGRGGFLKRALYAGSSVLIDRTYEGNRTFNSSEIGGKAIAQAISVSYYPEQSRTAGSVARKYGFAIGRDALTNVFREFWPDIAIHVLHRNP